MRRVNRFEIVRFIKYLIGGSVWFWSGYITFSICYSAAHWQWWQAKLLGDLVGWTLNYILQRYYAFASNKLKQHEGRHVWRYSLLTVVNFGLDYALIGGLKAVGITPYIGFFISAGFFTFWNYLFYKYWVFTEQPPRP